MVLHAPRGGLAAPAREIARPGGGRDARVHGAGLHHLGSQPSSGSGPGLSPRLLASGRHAGHGLRMPERLALVRRRLGVQPGLGVRKVPGAPLRGPAGPHHELGPADRGPHRDLLGRAVLGRPLPRPPLVPPAATSGLGPAAAASGAATTAPPSYREAARRGASSCPAAVGRASSWASSPGNATAALLASPRRDAAVAAARCRPAPTGPACVTAPSAGTACTAGRSPPSRSAG